MTLGNSYGLEIYCLVCIDKNRPQRIYKQISKRKRGRERERERERILLTYKCNENFIPSYQTATMKLYMIKNETTWDIW